MEERRRSGRGREGRRKRISGEKRRRGEGGEIKEQSEREITSRQEASDGQRFSCPALVYFLLLCFSSDLNVSQKRQWTQRKN